MNWLVLSQNTEKLAKHKHLKSGALHLGTALTCISIIAYSCKIQSHFTSTLLPFFMHTYIHTYIYIYIIYYNIYMHIRYI